MSRWRWGVLVWGLWLGCQSPEAQLILPTLTGIELDGDLSDWQGQGLRFTLTPGPQGEVDTADFAATGWLGQDAAGLWLAFEVRDDSLIERSGPLWEQDGVEVFLATRPGGRDLQQWLISPGMSPHYPRPRVDRIDFLKGELLRDLPAFPVASQAIPGGYRLEVHLPYEKLGPGYGPDKPLRLNLNLNDHDAGGRHLPHSLHYYPNTYRNRDAMFRMYPAGPAPQALAITRAYLLDTATFMFTVFGDGPPGAAVRLEGGGTTWAEAAPIAWGTGYQALLAVPYSPALRAVDSLRLWTGERYQYAIGLGDVPRRYVELPQPHRFEEDIRLFEKQDQDSLPPSCATLFVGSSSIRLWESLPEDFPELPIIRRGFGGATMEDVLYFYDRIVLPYAPETIVLFAGVNDIGKGRLPLEVVDHTERFVQWVARDLPGTQVVVLSHTISVGRRHLARSYRHTNTLLERMLRRYDHASFADVTTPILGPDGLPQPALYQADSIHLSPQGYAVWTQALRPILVPAPPDSLQP